MFVLKHVFIRGIFSYIFFRFEKMFKRSLVFTFLISLCWIYDLDGQYVCKYVCMSSLAIFICISGTIIWNLIKHCMNINLWYAVILPFYNVNLRGQTKVPYINICCKTSAFICIFWSIFWNLTKLLFSINI